MQALSASFGSYDEFQLAFTKACGGLFGSGWVFLVKGSDGALKITSEPNAGCPLKGGQDVPLLTCDVWEHAYYVDYRNARPTYVQAFWSLVNWSFVEQNWQA